MGSCVKRVKTHSSPPPPWRHIRHNRNYTLHHFSSLLPLKHINHNIFRSLFVFWRSFQFRVNIFWIILKEISRLWSLTLSLKLSFTHPTYLSSTTMKFIDQQNSIKKVIHKNDAFEVNAYLSFSVACLFPWCERTKVEVMMMPRSGFIEYSRSLYAAFPRLRFSRDEKFSALKSL